MNPIFTWVAVACLLFASESALGQENGPISSLSQRNMPAAPPSGRPDQGIARDRSWFYRDVPAPRQVQVHDLIHIRVDERSQAFSEGSIDRKKTGQYAAILTDWLRLDGLDSVKPAVQADGDQAISGTLNQRLKSEADMETTEGLKFTIASEVQELLPNGTIKLEARKTITVNDEVWIYHLRGICRTEDINPNNTVLSEHLAELSITKEDQGSIRDAYRRGWLLRLWDQVHWF